MMRIKNTFFVLIAIVLSASCTKNKGGNSTGNPSEILVVCDNAKWVGAVGDTIRSEFVHPLVGLMVREPGFALIFATDKDFDKKLHSHHNILIIDIGSDNAKSKVETLKDEWSQPQRVVKIMASSDTAFFTAFAKQSKAINELFNQNERAILRLANAQYRNSELEKLLEDEFGIGMVVPKRFLLAGKSRDFLWLQEKNDLGSFALMVYTYPYKDTAQLNPVAVLANRGKYSGMKNKGNLIDLMATNERYIHIPVSEKIIFKGMYALKTKGLLKLEGDSLGMPFINYTIVDAPRKRIVVFDATAFPPKNQNCSFNRQFESIIWKAGFCAPER